jgi:cobalt-zinc-cadmium efflux system membrane fusion protein
MRLILAATLTAALSCSALAHEGHDHSGGKFDKPAQSDSAAPLTLTDAAIHNLDIQTAPATLKPVGETVSVLAQVALAPEKQATIAPRFPGKVTRLEAKLGQAVTRGQPLVTLEPLSIGNAPVTLTAPAGGYVSAVRAVLGQVVEAGADLIEIGNTGQVLAKGSVYESPVVHRLQPGLPVTLTLDSLPGQTFSGTLQRFDRLINPTSRTFDAYAQLQGDTSSLLQGLQGEMTIALGAPQERLMIPKKAVLGDGGNLFVFVRDGNTFERRPVTLGQRSGAEVEVIEGVLPDEAVVVQGNYQLQYL